MIRWDKFLETYASEKRVFFLVIQDRLFSADKFQQHSHDNEEYFSDCGAEVNMLIINIS